VVNVQALIATAVNADGHRRILGLEAASGEDGAGWLALLRGLVARGLLSGVPKSAQPHVATQVRTIFDHADTDAVGAPKLPTTITRS
jgi:putative transposase